MIRLTLIWRNLWRNKTRTCLTVASVATSMFLLIAQHATVSSMNEVAASAARELRLVVHHKSTMTKLLPLADVPKIAALPGVRAVCPVRWFGGRIENSSEQFPSLAGEVNSMPLVYSDFELAPEELDLWRAERTAAVVGEQLCKRMGWTRGQRVFLRSTIPPYVRLEFKIVAITRAPAYPSLFGFRLDYLLDALKEYKSIPPELRDAAHFIWVKADSAAALETIPTALDATFAQSPDPTVTEPEEGFVAEFTMMFGNIPAILSAVGLILVLTVALVAGSTMSISLRDRLGELAVLRAIGFTSRQLLATLGAESMLVGLLGAAGGLIILAVLPRALLPAGAGIPYLPPLHVTWQLVTWGTLVGMTLGFAAGLPYVLRVARLPVVGTLRQLEA